MISVNEIECSSVCTIIIMIRPVAQNSCSALYNVLFSVVCQSVSLLEGAELHEADMVLVGAQVDFALHGCGHVVHVSLAEKGAPHIWTALSL